MLDALISAGANLLGGMLNRNAQSDFNSQQLAFGREQLDMQREFAKHGIQWKVEDAQAAGLHPLAALGAQTSSPSAVSVGGEAPKFDFGSLGQDLGRAAKAMQGQQAREAVDQEKERKLDLESKSLDNDIKKTALVSRAISTSRLGGQLGPPIPLPRPLGAPTRTVDGLAVAEDDLKQKQGDIPEQAFSRPFGYKLLHNPWFSDGQTSENRYGDSELLSTLKAAVNMAADHAYTGYMMAPEGPYFPPGTGYRVKRFRKGSWTAPSYRPWAD